MNRPSSMFTMFWFISTCWILFTWTRVAAGSVLRDGQAPDVIKVFVTEGDDVILPCSPGPNVNIEATVFDWRKDNKEVFLFDKGDYFGNGLLGQDQDFKGRVFHFAEELKHGNASILLRDTRTTDSGNFTCIFPHLVPEQRYRIELVVGISTKSYITILDGTTDWALLQCSVLGASPKPDVQWQNRAGDIVPAEEPQVTERGGRYDIILQTTVTKTDHYRCVSTQEEIHHQIYDETFVLLNGAGQKPVIKILGQTKDGVQLQCSVRGASHKPKVHWLDGDKNIVPAEEPQVTERGGSYDIILQTTVTKTDHYRCVSTQKEINHQTEAEIFVHLNDAGGTVPGWVVVSAAVVGFAVGVVVGAVVVYILLKKKTHSAVQSKSDSSGNSGLDRFRPDSSVVSIRRRPLNQDTDSRTSGSDFSVSS